MSHKSELNFGKRENRNPQYVEDEEKLQMMIELKDLRVRAGFRSQREAAEYVRVSLATWNAWESPNIQRHRPRPHWVTVLLRLIIANNTGIRVEDMRYGG